MYVSEPGNEVEVLINRREDIACLVSVSNCVGNGLFSQLKYKTFVCVRVHVCVLCLTDRVSLPRNMIENSMFEEEPHVVDLAKDSSVFPIHLSSPTPAYNTYYYIRPLFYV